MPAPCAAPGTPLVTPGWGGPCEPPPRRCPHPPGRCRTPVPDPSRVPPISLGTPRAGSRIPPPAPLGFEWGAWDRPVTWRSAIGPAGAMMSPRGGGGRSVPARRGHGAAAGPGRAGTGGTPGAPGVAAARGDSVQLVPVLPGSSRRGGSALLSARPLSAGRPGGSPVLPRSGTGGEAAETPGSLPVGPGLGTGGRRGDEDAERSLPGSPHPAPAAIGPARGWRRPEPAGIAVGAVAAPGPSGEGGSSPRWSASSGTPGLGSRRC